MRFAALSLALALGATTLAADRAVLVGLRDQDGALRTLFVARKGVALLQDQARGSVIVGDEKAVLRVTPEAVPEDGRVAWATPALLGLEVDASTAGARPFTKVVRSVRTLPGLQPVSLADHLAEPARKAVLAAAEEARRRNSRLLLPAEPDTADWGYVREEGEWTFYAAIKAREERADFPVPELASPQDRPRVSWRSAKTKHPGLTDLVADKDADFVLVVTPDAVFVHQASGSSLGRELRRVPARSETVVSTVWGGPRELALWQREVAAD